MPVVFCEASDKGGVQEIDVLLDFVAIVPEVVPHVYVIVCVKVLSWRETVKVCALFNVPLLADKVLFLAMVVNVAEPDAVTLDT